MPMAYLGGKGTKYMPKNRTAPVNDYVESILNKIDDQRKREKYKQHLTGVSQFAAMLAQKRNLDAEISAVAGLLHDIYKYSTGIGKYHSHNSAEYVKPVLYKMNLFTEEEQLIILSAIFHHADKKHVHDAYDEVLKDADALHHHFHDDSFDCNEIKADRIKKAIAELEIEGEINIAESKDISWKKVKKKKDVCQKFAKTASRLASKPVVGSLEDKHFKQILKYWPEDPPGDSLNCFFNDWNAAFVYHCCIESGFNLPVRYPNVSYRFCCVKAWLEWAIRSEVNLFIPYGCDIVPMKGDILVYKNNAGSGANLVNNQSPERMGVVLNFNGEFFEIAEGNSNFKNISEVASIRNNENIMGFIRLNDEYTYMGWQFDYKTGKYRAEPYIVS